MAYAISFNSLLHRDIDQGQWSRMEELHLICSRWERVPAIQGIFLMMLIVFLL